MEIMPASLEQVIKAQDGRTVVIDQDVGDIARRLKEIEPSLVLQYHLETDHYSVVQTLEDGSQQLVATCRATPGGAPDPRLLPEIARVASEGHDPVKELDRREKQRQRDLEHRHQEDVGPALERAWHQFAKDTMINQRRIFVPS